MNHLFRFCRRLKRVEINEEMLLCGDIALIVMSYGHIPGMVIPGLHERIIIPLCFEAPNSKVPVRSAIR